MSEPDPGFPRYPEISAQKERDWNKPPDNDVGSFRDWLRHTWGQLLILGVAVTVWVLVAVAIFLEAKDSWTMLGFYLLLTLVVVRQAWLAGWVTRGLWKGRSDK